MFRHFSTVTAPAATQRVIGQNQVTCSVSETSYIERYSGLNREPVYFKQWRSPFTSYNHSQEKLEK